MRDEKENGPLPEDVEVSESADVEVMVEEDMAAEADVEVVADGDVAVEVDAEVMVEEDREPAEVEQLQQELQTTKENLLRQVAEMRNYRRRIDRDRANWNRQSKMSVLREMVTVMDDIDRALADSSAQGEESTDPVYRNLREGVEMVYEKFMGSLAHFGVKPMETVGKPFDEGEHEAVTQMPAPEGTEPGTVVQEIKKGYRMGEHILRYAQVIVSS